MASFELVRNMVDRPWPVPDFIWNAGLKLRPWRYPLHRLMVGLRVVCYWLNGFTTWLDRFTFRLFVWVAAMDDILELTEERDE